MKALKDLTEAELQKYLGILAQATHEVMPGGSGPEGRAYFVLLVFDEGDIVQYVSNNTDRMKIASALLTAAQILEAKQENSRVPFPGETNG